MTHAALFLPLILTLSSFLGFSTAQAPTLCPWSKVMPDNNLHYSFVRTDNGHSTRLYHSSWSGSEQHLLLSCSWTEDAEVIRNYVSLCRQRPQDFSGPPKENLENFLLGADQCVYLTSGMVENRGRRDRRSVGGPGGPYERSEVAKHPRVKRGFIVPGTLWCGSGNKAPSYTDLGVFSNTDSCCREHDQCKHTILSFQSGFGVFNSNIFTMSHCDCDKTFRSCLREASDRISEVVEYTFFNLLKMHCFTLSNKLQCTERNWFGMCKKSQMALYADVHPPELSEALQPKACLNTSCIDNNGTIPAELLESSLTDPELHRMSTTASTSAAPASSDGSPSITAAVHLPDSAARVRPKGSALERKDELTVVPVKHQTVMSRYKNISEEQMSCGVYKDLDECRSKIPPQQTRHGLQNSEDRTLYHCNCTTRLFQTLAQQKQLTKVQTFLLGHVSLSCFLLQNCPTGNTCTAVVVKATLPGLNQRPAEMEEQRHLQAVRLKVSGKNMRAKRKDRLVRLYKLCQRMTRTKHTQKVTTRG